MVHSFLKNPLDYYIIKSKIAALFIWHFLRNIFIETRACLEKQDAFMGCVKCGLIEYQNAGHFN